jgi:hypothetical protein
MYGIEQGAAQVSRHTFTKNERTFNFYLFTKLIPSHIMKVLKRRHDFVWYVAQVYVG